MAAMPPSSQAGVQEPELTINVVSDVVCPWCFVGKRRLEAAIDLYKQRFPNRPDPVVTWSPFQLNPDMPAEGVDRAEHMAKKFGKEQLDQIHERMVGIGNDIGISFDFEATKRQPNTLAAHSLIELAAGHGLQDEMAEALFQAFFVDGADLTNNAVLIDIAVRAGLPGETAEIALANAGMRDHVAAQDKRARELGVSGVPFFIFNNKIAVSGAHEPESLLGAMIEAEKQTAAA